MSNALANLDRARTALAKATTLAEVKKIRDMAETARTYAKAAHLGREKQNKAAEIALLAARKAGAILKKLQKIKPQSAAKAAGDSEYRKALKDTGTPERTARYWQRLAEVPEFIAELYFANVRKAEKWEIGAAGLLREASKQERAFARLRPGFAEWLEKTVTEQGADAVAESLELMPTDMIVGALSLAERFGAPPFSALDLRQGYWSDRKRAWEKFGIKGEAGRGNEHEGVYGDSVDDISVFNPAVTETLYAWFAPKGGHILDPFAGGTTRGIVAAWLKYTYTGIELRSKQVKDNEDQSWSCGVIPPTWISDDSTNLSKRIEGQQFDLICTCPPYWNRERYTESDPRDLSRCKTYEEFMGKYEDIFRQAIAQLKDERFAVIVVADFRYKDTLYNLVGDTISCFQRLGLHYYDQIILLDPIWNSAQRVGKPFTHFRKVQHVHQNVLVFWKGNEVKRIPKALGVLEEVKLVVESEPATPVAQETKWANEGELTPVVQHGNYWIKRDDLFSVADVRGGKARTCWNLAHGASGLVTAGSRSSPQVNIVAQIAKHLGIPARAHTPKGELSPELLDAQAAGCEIVQHRAGYNNVIIARARADAAARGWREIPFGMECEEAVQQTRAQVRNVPREINRLVIPVGSGMSLAGVLWGMKDCGLNVPVLGVRVGADPRKQLAKYAPRDWGRMVTLVDSGSDYHKPADTTRVGDIALDPIYEGKCVPFLKPRDLLWIVGIRRTAAIAEAYREQIDEENVVAVK